MQEIGPRFTLKLQSLQKGTLDSKGGELEWLLKPDVQETSRRASSSCEAAARAAPKCEFSPPG